jgi:Polyketide cyclase / dehydrase and lipid transport
MSIVTETIEVDVPISVAYNQWTQFEDFPQFMGGIDAVSQIDDTHLHWVATIAGVRREWTSVITEQVPDKKIAWTATEGVMNSGLVTFDPVGPASTRVSLTSGGRRDRGRQGRTREESGTGGPGAISGLHHSPGSGHRRLAARGPRRVHPLVM